MIADREIIKLLGICADSFLGRFKSLTEVQRKAIPPIFDGKDVLVASATASGKTEAIITPLVARMIQDGEPKKKKAITVLIVAPTRALVNDLYKRLESPVDAVSWRCGRQTSDYAEKRKKPHVLITTPESFDSMLTYDFDRDDHQLVGHLLADVKALFLDEAHLYENSVRGEHVTWLVARLKRLKEVSFLKGWISSRSVQVCAGSATVSHSSDLATRLLGAKAEVIRVGGDREMHLFTPGLPNRWTGVKSADGTEQILELIRPIMNFKENIAELVWAAIENASSDGLRKVLIFVPSRALSDTLSASISSSFGKWRNIFVSGHHGSLDKSKREESEKMFSERRDSILVATSTLEVGVDIGDVDVIVLLGVPPDTSSLMQRIGRGGRRTGLIKLIPIPGNQIELLALSSMICSACKGVLEKSPPSRRWSVFIQQTISMIMQAGARGRKIDDMLRMVESVWGISSMDTAKSIIDHLVNEEFLCHSEKRLRLGEVFSDGIQSNRAYYHCNFEADTSTIPVVDHLTGQTLGQVKPYLAGRKQIAIGGETVDIIHSSNELLVRRHKKDVKNSFQYASRMPAITKSFAEHVRRGLGLGEEETLLVESETKGPVWFYFGGEMYGWVLQKLITGKLHSEKSLRGVALLGRVLEEDLKSIDSNIQSILVAVEAINSMVESYMGVGRFHKYLPVSVKVEVTKTMFDVESFLDWSMSRTLRPVYPGSSLWLKINSIIQEMSKPKK